MGRWDAPVVGTILVGQVRLDMQASAGVTYLA